MVSLSDNVAKNRVPTGTDQRRVYCTVSSVIRSCLLLFRSRIWKVYANERGKCWQLLLSYMFKTAVLAFFSNIVFKH